MVNSYEKTPSILGFTPATPSSALPSGGLVSSPHQPASTFSSSVPFAASLTAISPTALHRRHQGHYNLSLCLSKHFHGHCVGIPGVQTGPVPLPSLRADPRLSRPFHLSPSHWLRFISLCAIGGMEGPPLSPLRAADFVPL